MLSASIAKKIASDLSQNNFSLVVIEQYILPKIEEKIQNCIFFDKKSKFTLWYSKELNVSSDDFGYFLKNWNATSNVIEILQANGYKCIETRQGNDLVWLTISWE